MGATPMHLGQGFLGDGLLELAVGDLDHAVYSLALAEEAVRVGEPWSEWVGEWVGE